MKKSLGIQVEKKQVVETENKVQTVKNSLEVTNSSIKQTQMTSVNGYSGDECQNHAFAEKTKSSESKRTSRLVRNLKLTRAKHRVENETNEAKIKTKKDSEK